MGHPGPRHHVCECMPLQEPWCVPACASRLCRAAGTLRLTSSLWGCTCCMCPQASGVAADFRTRDPKDVRVLVVGCTGYIGEWMPCHAMPCNAGAAYVVAAHRGFILGAIAHISLMLSLDAPTGKFVTNELVKRGYNVVAFTREAAGIKGKLGKDDIIKASQGTVIE